MVKGLQAVFHGLAKEVPQSINWLHANGSEKVVRSIAIYEELERKGWLKAYRLFIQHFSLREAKEDTVLLCSVQTGVPIFNSGNP